MITRLSTIIEFHHQRTTAHVDCMNYFAGLLGYHFPEHDNDKHSGPMRDAYAYKNYARYHPEYNIPKIYSELCKEKCAEHHKTQPHHLEYYSDVSEISDLTLIEMVCDWFSASFEQRYITHEDPNDYTVQQFFDVTLRDNPKYKWSEKQVELICSSIDFLEMYGNYDDVMAIWRPLLAY